MLNPGPAMLPRGMRWLAFILSVSGCASSLAAQGPQARAGEALVFGRVEVVGRDAKDLSILVLPAGSSKALRYDLPAEGSFAWSLPPGEHEVLGFASENLWLNSRSIARAHAAFTVPRGESLVYTGTLILAFSGARY